MPQDELPDAAHPELIERYTGEGYWLDRTSTDYLDDVAARTPDTIAFIDARQRPGLAGHA